MLILLGCSLHPAPKGFLTLGNSGISSNAKCIVLSSFKKKKTTFLDLRTRKDEGLWPITKIPSRVTTLLPIQNGTPCVWMDITHWTGMAKNSPMETDFFTGI